MFSRLAALVAAGVLATAGLATSTAHASAPFTDSVEIRNNLDSGVHGSWAWDQQRRRVSIVKTAEGQGDAKDTYKVVLTDAGTFTTIKGAKSPQAGITMPRSVTGSFSGSYTFTVLSASAPTAAGVDNSYDYACTIGGSCTKPAETSVWPKLYFGEGAEVTANNDWRWTYRTCAETWVNSAAGNSGDITGKRCDRAVRADAPKVVQPECGTDRGTLVVPSDHGVYYRVNGKPWKAGEYKVLPGKYLVTAHDRDGYKLVGDRTWKLTVNKAEACPTPTPTPTVSPSPTTEPTTTPDPNPETSVATPKAPTLEQATCTTAARVTIPEVEGVVYRSGNGTVLEQGKTYSVNAGKVSITAEAADGYTLKGGAATEWWPLTVAEAPDCPTATPTSTQRVVVVNNIPVPSRVDTGFGGLAR